MRSRLLVFLWLIAMLIFNLVLSLYVFTDVFTSGENEREEVTVNSAQQEDEANQLDDQHNADGTNKNNTERKSDNEQNNETKNNVAENTTESEDVEGTENETVEKLDIKSLSDKLLNALEDRDMALIAEYVDPEAGLLFSPYVYVRDDAPVLTRDEVRLFLEDETVYHWGDYDGKGTPIELTPEAYMDEFLEPTLFKSSDDILVDDLQDRGNTINNIAEAFPNARVLEYYYEGTEEYAGIDWQSLLFVYSETENGELMLRAIIRDIWTI